MSAKRKTRLHGFLLIAAGLVLAAVIPVVAHAQEHQGRHGVGHDTWHEQFYAKLVRKGTRRSCCSNADCSPTTSRMTPNGYEVLVEGEWTKVPPSAIIDVTAPDGGAHVCFPKQPSNYFPKGTLFCVVLPPEI